MIDADELKRMRDSAQNCTWAADPADVLRLVDEAEMYAAVVRQLQRVYELTLPHSPGWKALLAACMIAGIEVDDELW